MSNFSEIQKLFHSESGIDLKAVIANAIDFNNITQSDIKKLNSYIKQHSCIYKMEKVILYHGTCASHDIKNQGIKKTTSKTKKSIQSCPGFVCLSLYPHSAKTFGEMAYPNQEISVFAVEVPVKDLKADLDQLKNKRLWDPSLQHINNSIAESLIYGNGARVKRNVENYEVREITNIR
jgi:hypothetical protein